MISVIIPIYNTGEYLRDCISSICAQTYKDLQIIMIDDGSQPETARICDELAAADSRIELVHKKNEGVSVARNLGLEMVKGDIVCFVDSDDTIHPEMFATFADQMVTTGADIVMCDAVTIEPGRPNESDSIVDYPKSTLVEIGEVPPSTLSRLAGSAWRCGYRTAMLRDAGVHFPQGIKFSEDRIFNLMTMGCARTLMYVKKPFYNRLIRKGSACFRYYPDMTVQIVKMRKVLLSVVTRFWGPAYILIYEQQIAGQILYAVTNYTATYSGLGRSESLSQLKALCLDRDIRKCLVNAQAVDIRSRLILNKRYRALYLMGKLTNLYHRLCQRGQYRQ